MIQTGSHHGRRRRRDSGLSLVEAVISVLIVGGLFVAGLNTVAASRGGQVKTNERGRAHLLAQLLMSEILEKPFEDQVDEVVFGREATESGPTRLDFDDVDDYMNWSVSPPEDRIGNVVPNSSTWSRNVSVEWVNPDDLSQTSGTNTGAKRITVTVKDGNRVLATLVAVRTSAR